MDSREHFGIVGGGLLGMTLALRLRNRGYRVTLVEAADHVGGLADAWQLGDVTWDRHYHVTLLSDTHLRGLLRELGLDEQMQWRRTKTGFLVDGNLHSLSNVWEFLRFPPLGLFDKLRLGWTIWYASRVRDSRPLEEIPVADWLLKHSGRRTLQRIWLPLLKAKLGAAWERTSAAFIWATIQRMYAARHSGHKHELFGYLPGGYARMLAAFRQRLIELGVDIRTGCKVAEVREAETDGMEIVECSGRSSLFDRIAITTPSAITAQMCPQLTAAESERLRSIEYAGILCASLLLKKPLADYYVTNVTDAAPFTGVIEMTALVDPAEVGGHTLLYLPKYVAADDPAWLKSDAEIQAQFVAALARLYPQFSVPPIATSIPGLYIVNSAQIVNSTLNVNETVRLAEASLETLCRPLDTHQVQCPQIRSSTPNQHATADRELVARPG
ncbi:MAG: FAD-dependent oxidoreductase [Planctomycetia bacterium]|nr:FAD-dependent oxidoreductase [Planctomycetia bacterium]